MKPALDHITKRFDAAAGDYDRAVTVHAEIAAQLVGMGATKEAKPAILDIGCGTGLLAIETQKRWPEAHLTLFDSSPAMLHQAFLKLPKAKPVLGDAARPNLPPHSFNLIFSSMMLHWLPEPRVVLENWQKLLKPGGTIYVALMVEGSFGELTDLYVRQNLKPGTWIFPRADFVDSLAATTEQKPITCRFSSALDFMQHIKNIGAAAPRADYVPLMLAEMLPLLKKAPQPFTATYQMLFLKIDA
jgi:ubiquinone/menaquinone biosynthesis C-methylase UbiE